MLILLYDSDIVGYDRRRPGLSHTPLDMITMTQRQPCHDSINKSTKARTPDRFPPSQDHARQHEFLYDHPYQIQQQNSPLNVYNAPVHVFAYIYNVIIVIIYVVVKVGISMLVMIYNSDIVGYDRDSHGITQST